MKKILLLLPLFLLLGCNKIESFDVSFLNNSNYLEMNDIKYVNTNLNGFKLYLPKGVIIDKTKNNNVIFSCENEKLYLYVDVVSYFYKNKISVDEIDNYDYYKDISEDGFLIIDESNGKYLVIFCYNYSVIEFYTTKDKMSHLLTNSFIILKSIKFNDILIEREIINNKSSEEKVYDIFDFEKNNSNFSQYLNSSNDEKEDINILPD